MARESKPTTSVDEEGFVTDGMYRRRGAKQKYDPAERRQQIHELVDDFKLPAMARVKRIRESLTKVIAPYIDGPHDPQTVRERKEFKVGDWLEHLTLTDREGVYRINAERNGWHEDVVDALRENDELERLLTDGSDINLIVRLAIRQGQLLERAKVRDCFAPLVVSGRNATIKRPEAMRAARSKTLKIERRENHQLANESMKWARHNFPAMQKVTILKRHAADRLKISVGTLNRWLSKPK
jgi:hypothetical protein